MQTETRKLMGELTLLAVVLGIWRYLSRRISFLSAFSICLSSASTFVVRAADASGALFASVWLALASLVGYGAGRFITSPFRAGRPSRAFAESCLLICLFRELTRFHRLENKEGAMHMPALVVCSCLAAAIWTALSPSSKT